MHIHRACTTDGATGSPPVIDGNLKRSVFSLNTSVDFRTFSPRFGVITVSSSLAALACRPLGGLPTYGDCRPSLSVGFGTKPTHNLRRNYLGLFVPTG